jgi:OFA family oxalate/formate antiporter-like MFS transporter
MMLAMFSLEAAALLGMRLFGRDSYAFIVFAALTLLFWGEIFVIFPAICGDSFGIQPPENSDPGQRSGAG